MARLIVKWRYHKPGTPKHGQNFVRYIATREGVEKCDESWKMQPATREQTRLAKELLANFPSAKESYEYEDYCKAQTKYTASRLICKALDENIDLIVKKENYIGYIAKRPRVEKQGAHGLFSQEDKPIDLNEVAGTVAGQKGVVWTTVLSLRREDAARLGYDNAKAWKELLRGQAQTLATAMGIPLGDLRWYAAYHDEGGHPHVHLVSYSQGRKPYMTEAGLARLKAAYAHEIFRQDLYQAYDEQTKYRDELRRIGKERLQELAAQIRRGGYENETAEALLLRLRDEIKDYHGKKVYGYLPARMKNLVNGIVDELASDARIKELYELWYGQKEEIVRTYRDAKPERLPLSCNDEFKSIRNAVVQEAAKLSRAQEPVEDIPSETEPDIEPSDEEIEAEEPRTPKDRWEFYQAAKSMLDRNGEAYDPSRAAENLIESAKLGCKAAKYQLGKLFLRGEHLPKNTDYALRWLEESVADKNRYAEYLLGELLLKGEDTERDAERAEELLKRSAKQGNKYAAYTLGKALTDGDILARDAEEGIEHLTASADKGFMPAEYLLGKLLYCGEIAPRDVKKALFYLENAAENENTYAAYLAGKILLTEESVRDVPNAVRYFELAASQGNSFALYRLGRLYLSGKDVPKDYDRAMGYLKAAAGQGNQYAEKLLHSVTANRDWSAGLCVLRLFRQLGSTMQSRVEEGKKGKVGLTDRKLRRVIDEKKQAQGLKYE